MPSPATPCSQAACVRRGGAESAGPPVGRAGWSRAAEKNSPPQPRLRGGGEGMRRGPGTEAAYRRLTKGRTMERGRGPGPGPGPCRGLDRVASVLGVGRRVGLGIGPGRAEGVAVQGPSDAEEGPASPHRAKPGSGREPTRVGSGPDSACVAEGAPGGESVVRQGLRDAGKGTAPPRGGAHMCGLRPSAGLCGRWRARLQRCR